MTHAPPTLPPQGPWLDPSEIWTWIQQRWLQILGVLFLLIGLALFFHHSIEHGWLTPTVRVVMGLASGLFLGVVGARQTPRRRVLGHVMMGGASASLYLSVWSAYMLFGLIQGQVAFASLIGVTSATFVAAVRYEGQGLACMATLGGFMAPVLIGGGTWGTPYDELALAVYLCVMVAGATALMLMRRWGMLNAMVVVLTWLAMLGLVLDATDDTTRMIAQGAIGVSWVCLCAVPVAKQLLDAMASRRKDSFTVVSVLVSTGMTTMLTCAMWYTPGAFVWTVGGILCASAYGAACVVALGRGASGRLSMTLAALSLGFMNLTVLHVFEGPALWSVLAIEAAALTLPSWFARKDSAARDLVDVASIAGHALLLVLLVGAFGILVDRPTPGLDAQTLQLALTCAATLAVAHAPRPGDLADVQPVLEWVAYVVAMVSWMHQMQPMLHGELVGTAGWGAVGVALTARGDAR